jgi:two-component system chemotaxis sensor kinase CheA
MRVRTPTIGNVMNRDSFLKKLLATFKTEAQDHLNAMSSCLIELEKTPDPQKQAEMVEMIFREAHSLKGAARSVNIAEIESVCQSLESNFSALKRNEMPLSKNLFDLFHLSVDIMNQIILTIDTERTQQEKSKTDNLVRKLAETLTMKETGREQALPLQKEHDTCVQRTGQTTGAQAVSYAGTSDTMRVSVSKMDSIMLQVEGLLSEKMTSEQRNMELKEISSNLSSWKKEWSKTNMNLTAVEKTLNSEGNGSRKKNSQKYINDIKEFLDWNSNFIRSLQSRITVMEKSWDQNRRSLASMIDSLIEDTKKVLMIPFSSLLQIVPKLVRDLSNAQGKNADIVIHGSETEIYTGISYSYPEF